MYFGFSFLLSISSYIQKIQEVTQMKASKIPLPKKIDESLFNLFVTLYEFFILKDGRKIVVNKKNNTWCYIQKHSICSILRNMYFEAQKQTISNASINVVFELIRSIADNCTDIIMSVDGLSQTHDSIIYDIQGSDKYISIIENDVKILDKKKSKIIFLNNNPPSSQPISPNLNILTNQYLEVLKKVFMNIKNDVLFAVYLALLFVRNINHPLLIISGEYGAAKTTFTRMVAKIANPQCGDVSPMPKSLDDVATVIHNSYFTAFNNLSYISRELADLLCLATTGGNYQKRKLYTDSDVSSMYLHNPIAINGLNLSFPYSDLMDRAIVLELSRISPSERLSEEDVWEKFYHYLPDIQGCIFKLLSKAIYTYKDVKLTDTPRLADFARWGYAVAESIEIGLGNEFLCQYKENANNLLKSAAESNPLLNAVSNLMANIDYWEGSSTKLLVALQKAYYSTTISNQLPRSFPTTANVLSRRLNILQNDLKVLGFSLNIGRDSKRYISITKNMEV